MKIFVLAIIIVVLSGCASPRRVSLAYIDEPEMVLLAEVLAMHLENNGFEVQRVNRLSGMEELAEGMQTGGFDVSLVFAQDALAGIFGEPDIYDTWFAQEVLRLSLQDMFGYVLLDSWAIDGRYALGVEQGFTGAAVPGIGLLAGIAPSMVLYAAPGSAVWLDMLRDNFGIEFGQVVFGEGQGDAVARRNLFLIDYGFMVVDELNSGVQSLLHPIISEAALARHPELHSLITALSSRLSIDGLLEQHIINGVSSYGAHITQEDARRIAEEVFQGLQF